MTKVNPNRPVVRETSAISGRRAIVVSFDDPDKITMWVKGSHKKYKMPFLTIYTLAVQAAVDSKKKVKKAVRGFSF